MATESLGVVRVARQVLLTIIANVTSGIPGVIHMAQGNDQGVLIPTANELRSTSGQAVGKAWSRFLGREVPRDGVALTIKDNTVSADLYIVVASGVHIVEVGSAIQEEVASAIEEMVGMRVHEVNVYIQDVA